MPSAAARPLFTDADSANNDSYRSRFRLASRIRRKRVIELHSLEKGSTTDDSDDETSSSSSTDSDDSPPPPPRQSPRPPYLVYAAMAIGVVCLAALAYFVFSDYSSSSTTTTTSSSANTVASTTPSLSTTTSSAATAATETSEMAQITSTASKNEATTSSAKADNSAKTSEAAHTTASTSSSEKIAGATADKSAPTTTAATEEAEQTATSSFDVLFLLLCRRHGYRLEQLRLGHLHRRSDVLLQGAAGACGDYHSDDDLICALQTSTYDSGSHCGVTITITRTDGTGGSVDVLVADECPGCSSTGSVDLSVAAFTSLGTEDEGTFQISWSF